MRLIRFEHRGRNQSRASQITSVLDRYRSEKCRGERHVGFDHVLGLTAVGSKYLTSAEITMLVAIDAQKLFELTQEGHQIWTFQLVLVMATSLFLYELGPVIL